MFISYSYSGPVGKEGELIVVKDGGNKTADPRWIRPRFRHRPAFRCCSMWRQSCCRNGCIGQTNAIKWANCLTSKAQVLLLRMKRFRGFGRWRHPDRGSAGLVSKRRGRARHQAEGHQSGFWRSPASGIGFGRTIGPKREPQVITSRAEKTRRSWTSGKRKRSGMC